ncbi:hypothetical protein GCM10008931_20010 [Oceanobacillus oncorhynchi subsp. oncorhynchi]
MISVSKKGGERISLALFVFKAMRFSLFPAKAGISIIHFDGIRGRGGTLPEGINYDYQ